VPRQFAVLLTARGATAFVYQRKSFNPEPCRHYSSPRNAIEHEILDWCDGRIAGYKRPRSVALIEEKDMPRTATSKILHRVLRDRYGATNT
jgi:acyl-coenzyme A synthetase/AMP-(fatty) acid ligase